MCANNTPQGNRIIDPISLSQWFGGQENWWKDQITKLHKRNLVIMVENQYIGDPSVIQGHIGDPMFWGMDPKVLPNSTLSNDTNTDVPAWRSNDPERSASVIAGQKQAAKHAQELGPMCNLGPQELIRKIGWSKVNLIGNKPPELQKKLLTSALAGASRRELNDIIDRYDREKFPNRGSDDLIKLFKD
jgi:hypothetical protein